MIKSIAAIANIGFVGGRIEAVDKDAAEVLPIDVHRGCEPAVLIAGAELIIVHMLGLDGDRRRCQRRRGCRSRHLIIIGRDIGEFDVLAKGEVEREVVGELVVQAHGRREVALLVPVRPAVWVIEADVVGIDRAGELIFHAGCDRQGVVEQFDRVLDITGDEHSAIMLIPGVVIAWGLGHIQGAIPVFA